MAAGSCYFQTDLPERTISLAQRRLATGPEMLFHAALGF